MKVLVAVVAREEELQRARKHLGYERLILAVPRGTREAWAKHVEGIPAQVEEFPDHDLLACLEKFEGLFRDLRKEHLRVAVDGGTGAMSHGAFLACLSQGVEAHWLLARPVKLPVLKALPVARRFSEEQLAILRVLEGRAKPEELAQRAKLGEARAKEALLALRKQGVVETSAQGASLTALGHYLQRGLAAR